MKLGVVYAPGGAVLIRELVRLSTSTEGVKVRALLRHSIARREPEVARLIASVIETRVVPDDPAEADLTGLDAVTTMCDSELAYSDALRARLGSRGAAPRAWDKDFQRQSLREAGLSSLRSSVCLRTKQLPLACDEVGFPVVVKPLRGAGGDGVYTLTDISEAELLTRLQPEDRAWAVETLIAASTGAGHPDVPWMGSMFSVEMVTEQAGKHRHLTTFGKFPVQTVRVQPGLSTLRVCGDVHPAPIAGGAEQELIHLVGAALDVLEVSQRVTHTEVFVGPDGPEVVEVNGRMGGYLQRLLDQTSELDLVATAVEVACGIPPSTSDYHTGRTATGFFPSFVNLSGNVVSNVDMRLLRSLPGVLGVSDIARHGSPRAAADGRLCNMTLVSTGLSGLGQDVQSVVQELDALFAADEGLIGSWQRGSLA